MFSTTFTFESSRSPSVDANENSTPGEASRSVSPFTPPSAHRLSVTDLTAQLGRQRIRPEAQICYDSYASYANTDVDADWSLPTDVSSRQSLRNVPTRAHSPSRRKQRQTNSRLLCSSTHHRDIAALLSQMLESEDQCSVAPLDSLSSATTRESSNGDERYDSGSGEGEESRAASMRTSVATLKYRRASEFRVTGAAIGKEVRLRMKDRVHRRQKSGENE